jgi:hypothetical protein
MIYNNSISVFTVYVKKYKSTEEKLLLCIFNHNKKM